MKNFLIIGAGSIGKRHIESIADLNLNFNIHTVDPLNQNLKIAENLFNKKNNNKFNKNYYNYSDIKKINTDIDIDIAIIATTANVRFKILKNLIGNVKIKFLILEKIAFDNISDYEKAMVIVKKNKIPTYINFPRRLNNYYDKLKNKLKKQNNIFMSVVGNNWGFASNSFHNLDLFMFLTSSKKIKNVSSEISKKLYTTNRKNFIELKGYFTFENEFNDKIIMEDFKNLNSKKNSMYGGIKIETEETSYIAYENYNKILEIDNKNKANIKINNIKIENQSSLTSKIFLKILNKKNIKLPTLEESFVVHKSILEIFNKKLSKLNIT